MVQVALVQVGFSPNMHRLRSCHAIVMITGTSVGTGILGLPILTSQAGLAPTLIAFFVTCLFMTQSALYILDVKLHYQAHYPLSSLIKLSLGKTAHRLATLIMVVLLYALLCTYTMTGAAWVHLLCGAGFRASRPLLTILFVLLFGALTVLKKGILYPLNNLLGIGLSVAFVSMVGLSLWPIDIPLIQRADPPAILGALPLLLTAFGFSIVVPLVTEYLEYDARRARGVILIGSLLALTIYVIWEWVTLGHIPHCGAQGLQSLEVRGDDGTGVIRAFAAATHNQWATRAGQWFAIFADITSFLGVSLALMHVLQDITGFKKQGEIVLLSFIPPLVITLFYPKAFVQILSFAGLSVGLLLGLLPVLMRANLYRAQTQSWPTIMQKGGIMMVCTPLFFIAVILIELHNLLR